MPDTLTAPPPSAPASPASPAAAPGPKPSPPRVTTKFNSMNEALAANAGPGTKAPPEPPRKPHTPSQVVPAPEPPKPVPVKEDAAPPAPGDQPAPKPADQTPPPSTVDGKPPQKENNWKALRTRAETAERRLKDLEATRVPDQERSALTSRMETVESENKRLREEIRYSNYQKHPEFQEKYEKPYQNAMAQTMNQLRRIPVTDDATGQQRAANEQDFFDILTIQDPVEQLQAAQKKFGDFSDRVLAQVDKVAETIQQRDNALTEARATGEQREKDRLAQQTAQQAKLRSHIEKLFVAEHTALTANPEEGKLFNPVKAPEGQQLTPEEQAHNEALDRGYKLVDEWWGKRVNEAKTEDELTEIVKHHVAIRNRAAAFGPLKRQFKALQKQFAAQAKELEQFRSTTPPAGGRQTTGAPANGRKGSFEERFAEGARRLGVVGR